MKLFRSATRDRDRKAQRVLVMLDYGEGDPCNGEVFDVTALAMDLASKDEKHHDARVTLKVSAMHDWSAEKKANGDTSFKTEACWNVMVAFDSSGETGWLDDAVNAAMPTTSNNETILKSIRRTEKKLEQLRAELKRQRLDEAAQVRAKHPVCRIMESPMLAVANDGKGAAGV